MLRPRIHTYGSKAAALPLYSYNHRQVRRGQRLISHVSAKPLPEAVQEEKSALGKLSNKVLFRSAVLTTIMATSWLLRPSLAVMGFLTRSKSAVLDADKNPAMNLLLRWSIYNQFCAGTNTKEVAEVVKEVKGLGYHGVILGYAREIVVDHNATADSRTGEITYGPRHYEVIEEWKQGNLDTLAMLDAGDFIGLKVTGAGPVAVDAMQAGKAMPAQVEKALDEICLEARKKGCRVWLDAEQQALQPTLDNWALRLMKKHNYGGYALVYNTIQGYLKGARANAERHIATAAREGWTVAIKLVRGAYIENEVRSLIHDTKEETDLSYNDIADMLISRRMPKEAKDLKFPDAALFLATHNAASAEKAFDTYKKRVVAGLPLTPLECGQIFGMADELGFKLLQDYEKSVADPRIGDKSPRILKCIPWGSVGECMEYLFRRAVENRGAVERTQHMAEAMRGEVRRRIFG